MSCRLPAIANWVAGSCRAAQWWGRSPSMMGRRKMRRERYLQRQLGRRDMLRRATMGAGAVGLGLSGASRFALSAWAQDATPEAAQFDAAACYQSFPGATTVQYEKIGDPPYNIGLSNSYIGNVWRTQMIKMAKAYSETADIKPLIGTFQVNTADRDD